jgi:hypothetical protein
VVRLSYGIFGEQRLVRHEVENFEFDLHYLSKDDSPNCTKVDDVDGRVSLPQSLTSRSWLRGHSYTFIEPGTKALYRYLVRAPRDVLFIVVSGKFRYKEGPEIFEAMKVFRVPTESNHTRR